MTGFDHPEVREEKALHEVITRLRQNFPNRGVADIETAVRRRYEAFTSSPIRDFIPVLVERAARDDLAHRI